MNMKSMKINVVNESLNPLPHYAHFNENGETLDSGADVHANLVDLKEKFCFDTTINYDDDEIITSVTIHPGGRVLIPTGIHTAIPQGYEIQVRDRSGVALKKGLVVVNGIGTIDSCFRGDIGVILGNISNHDVDIVDGEPIAQLVLAKIEQIDWNEVESLDETERGSGAYGSTNK